MVLCGGGKSTSSGIIVFRRMFELFERGWCW
jgi:NAD-dependent SIR2 family protein deacetylase